MTLPPQNRGPAAKAAVNLSWFWRLQPELASGGFVAGLAASSPGLHVAFP